MSHKLTTAFLFGILTVAGCEPPPKVKPTPPATTAEQPPAQPPETEKVAAGVGVGIKGRSLDEYEGAVVTPAKTLFAAKERIVFEIEIPHTLNLYKATNGNGPQSHEEFMEKIIQEGQIQLPKLPEGHRYVFDPETQQLLVERPKRQ